VSDQIAAASGSSADEGPRGFDLKKIRLSQERNLTLVKAVLLTVPVRKPHRQEFIRVRPGEEHRIDVAALESGETFVVDSGLAAQLGDEVVAKRLYQFINRQGVVSLWPVKLPDADGRLDDWNRSAHEIAALAEEQWTSVRSNRLLGAYEPFCAAAAVDDPVWPEEGFEKILGIAFRDRFIAGLDHPVLRRLRGEP
jgi:hypothetical protein